jgi:hypothetical protein
VVIAALAAGGCGTSHHKAAVAKTTSASLAAGANPVAAPPFTDAALSTGTAQHQITATVAAFYRAAYENDALRACSLFSPNGLTGFMRAAAVSFPASINKFSTCKEAMQIYNASLATSITNLQNSDPSVSGAALNNVTVGRIKLHGGVATAIGPLNALPMVNPKQISLVRLAGRWLIDGSYSLSKSNLPAILKRAGAEGKLKPKRK